MLLNKSHHSPSLIQNCDQITVIEIRLNVIKCNYANCVKATLSKERLAQESFTQENKSDVNHGDREFDNCIPHAIRISKWS